MIELALKKQREEEKMVFTFESNVLEGIKFGGSKGKLGK
jgi:D-alanine-D-alanine ligase